MKCAAKETGICIYYIATAMQAKPNKIPIINFARQLIHAGPVSVISVP
jgi:hypothetical protein